MYVTITPTSSGALAAHGPHPDPVTVPDPGLCLVLCPRSAIDRVTWRLCHPYEFGVAPKALTLLPEQRPTAVTVADLNAPTVAVILHTFSWKILAVGPFPGPDHAEQWWHVRSNRYANGDALCHVLPLTTPDTVEAGQR